MSRHEEASFHHPLPTPPEESGVRRIPEARDKAPGENKHIEQETQRLLISLREHKTFLEDQIEQMEADIEDLRVKSYQVFRLKAAMVGDPRAPMPTEAEKPFVNERLDALNEDIAHITKRLVKAKAELFDVRQIERYLAFDGLIDSHQKAMLEKLEQQSQEAV